jgi:hypothetical protein
MNVPFSSCRLDSSFAAELSAVAVESVWSAAAVHEATAQVQVLNMTLD